MVVKMIAVKITAAKIIALIISCCLCFVNGAVSKEIDPETKISISIFDLIGKGSAAKKVKTTPSGRDKTLTEEYVKKLIHLIEEEKSNVAGCLSDGQESKATYRFLIQPSGKYSVEVSEDAFKNSDCPLQKIRALVLPEHGLKSEVEVVLPLKVSKTVL